MKEFVFAIRDIFYKDIVIKKNEIGILKNKLENKVIVNFVYLNIILEVSCDDIKLFDPAKTGDQFEKKVCNVCHRLLDIKLFQKNQNAKNNRTVRRPSCNDCRAIIDGKNMTTKEKNEMNKIKPHMEIWTCKICKKTTIPGLTSKVVCDHDHLTGHPRDWICDSCNTGLGRFKDDILLLQNAISYIKYHKEKNN